MSQKQILYVDDDEDDRQLFLEAIREQNKDADIIFAENGLEALDYLQHSWMDAQHLPCLIVLDINMPFLDGKETFQQIKKNEHLKEVPIVIFTSSEKPADRAWFNQCGIEFISKPHHFSFMNNIAHRMLQYCC